MSSKSLKRPTYNVVIDNIPNSVSEREVNKTFIAFGEIQHIYVRHSRYSKRAFIKYLCEPDADRVVQEFNGFMWYKNILRAKREDCGQKEQVGKSSGSKNTFCSSSQSGRSSHASRTEDERLSPLKMSPEPSVKSMTPVILQRKESFPFFDDPKSPIFGGVDFALPEERELICTYIENAVTFYGHCVTKSEAVNRMSTILQQTCISLPRMNKTPAHKKIYAALYTGDNLFYRCKVLSANYGKAMVRYIDYGNSEEVPFNRMVELPEGLRKQPCLAPKCVITTVTLNSIAKYKKSFYQGIEFLQQNILGKKIIVTTCTPENRAVFEVQALTCNNQDIVQCLLKEHYVMPKLAEKQDKFFSVGSKNWKYAEEESDTTQFSIPLVLSDRGSCNSFSSTSPSRSPSNKYKEHLVKLQAEIADLEQELKLVRENKSCKEVIFDKLHTAADRIQAVNSFRMRPIDRKYITEVFDMLQSVDSDIFLKKKELEKKVEDALADYRSCLRSVSSASDKIECSSMIEKKKDHEKKLGDCMKEYISLPQNLDESMVLTLKATANNLKNQMYTDHDIVLDEEPSFLEELIHSYGEERNAQESEEVKNKTNEMHNYFIEQFSNMFSLCDGITGDRFSFQLSDKKHPEVTPLAAFPSESFLRSLDLVNEALKTEIRSKNLELSREKSKPTVVKCLLGKINSLLDEYDRDQIQKNKYTLLLKNFAESKTIDKKVADLNQVKKEIKSIKSRLRHKLVDKKDLEEIDISDEAAISRMDDAINALLRELHDAFIHEDFQMQMLATLYETMYPDIDLEHAKLGIAKYAETKGIFKEGWEADHFMCSWLPGRLGLCYRSLFSNELVALKEFLLETEEKSKELIERILRWNVLADHVMPVSAVFKKSERQVYAMTSFMDTIAETPPATPAQRISVVLKVLDCLECLHSANLIHGVTHPTTVLIDDDIVKLDFCFESKRSLPAAIINGVNYLPPELSKGHELSKATDMYLFGCFTLSVLFPDCEFSSTAEKTPNILEHKNKIEKDLSASDYSILSSLLCPNPVLRAPAMTVLKRGFLKSANAFSEDCKSTSDGEDKDLCDLKNALQHLIAQSSLKPTDGIAQQCSEVVDDQDDKESVNSEKFIELPSDNVELGNDTNDHHQNLPESNVPSSVSDSNDSSNSYYTNGSESLVSLDSSNAAALKKLFALRETLRVPVDKWDVPKEDTILQEITVEDKFEGDVSQPELSDSVSPADPKEFTSNPTLPTSPESGDVV